MTKIRYNIEDNLDMSNIIPINGNKLKKLNETKKFKLEILHKNGTNPIL